VATNYTTSAFKYLVCKSRENLQIIKIKTQKGSD